MIFFHFLKIEANIPGIINAINASPGAAKINAPNQCHSHTSLAAKKTPIVSGSENLKKIATRTAVIAQKEPKRYPIPT